MNNPLASVAYSFVNNSANNSSSMGTNWTLWVWLSLIGLVIAICVFFVWYWDLQTPVTPTETVPLKPVSQTDTRVLLEQVPERQQESWCFVGEDKTGRWCLRVPNSHACDPDRTYTSQADCELVTASAMPLGFLKNGGASSVPLSAIPAMSNTEVV